MENVWGIVLLGAVGASALLPYIITFLISLDTTYVQKDRKLRSRISAFIFGIGLFCNSAVILLGHRVLFDRWNFLKTAGQIFNRSFACQEIKFYSLLLLGASAAGAVIGIGIRWLLPRIVRRNYGRGFLTARRRVLLFLTGILTCVLGIGTMFCSFNGVSRIVINEVAPFNKSLGIGEIQSLCDYVELYNKGCFDWYASQLYLSDEAGNLKKWEIPEGTIPAKGYRTIGMDSADFSISRKGAETLFLSDDLGRILDQVTLPAVIADVAYGRTEDGGPVWDTVTQTPEASNNLAKGRRDVQVTLSQQGGFYPEPFYLTMETEPNYKIYYTTDGSIPDETAIAYTEPVYIYNRSQEPNLYKSLQRVVLDWKNYEPDTTPVDKGFLLRAVAIAEDGSYGDTVTATYFVDLEKYLDKPVVSLAADPEELFGEDGIYMTGKAYDKLYLSENVMDRYMANFIKDGREMEIAAHMEYYGAAEDSFGQNIGLRISGSSSREGKVKRFAVYARNQYSGSPVFEKELFPGVTTRRIQLRSGYVNGVTQLLVADRNVAIQNSSPVTVFVNGEYWQESYILEKYDGHYFQERYGIREEDVVINKNTKLTDGKMEYIRMYDAVFEYLDSHDMKQPEAYAGFAELVDIQSYIDFMCANVYMNNMDFSETKNSVWWRSRTVSNRPYGDGKWRFALYDMDFVDYLSAEDRVKVNLFTEKMPFSKSLPEQPIYTGLKVNPDFCRQFVLTFMDMVNTNFRYENVAKILDSYDSSVDSSSFHTFFRERGTYMVPYMAEEFGLTGTLETITLGKSGGNGTVSVNTAVPDLSAGSWSGRYYTDYPVTVTAVAEAGYRFVGWDGDICSEDPTLEITLPTGGVTINAIFEKE